MKVLFLDFDGVLNSAASFKMEHRRKTVHIADTLSTVNCSNLQYILEQDRDVKIVISSTWRRLHSKVELQNILNSYGVEAARIVGQTPQTFGGHRGHEINLYLEENPNITKYVIIDDDPAAETGLCKLMGPDDEEVKNDPRGIWINTAENDGLQFKDAIKAARFFRGETYES